jgi:hypothetical protein
MAFHGPLRGCALALVVRATWTYFVWIDGILAVAEIVK